MADHTNKFFSKKRAGGYAHTMVVYVLLFMSIPVVNASVENEILDIMQAQQLAWNKGDIPGFMSGYWQSDTLRFASGSSVTFGWQATLDRYLKKYPDSNAMGRLEFSGLDIKPLSENYTLVFGHWRLLRKNDQPNGVFTLLFRQTENGWKIIHDHSS